ncbi:hypothetical protein Pelo_18720 [Pelomyxa schiedti]|nr:hypothetical protein Pelo_18720 [Pelomyxa schiedti]
MYVLVLALSSGRRRVRVCIINISTSIWLPLDISVYQPGTQSSLTLSHLVSSLCCIAQPTTKGNLYNLYLDTYMEVSPKVTAKDKNVIRNIHNSKGEFQVALFPATRLSHVAVSLKSNLEIIIQQLQAYHPTSCLSAYAGTTRRAQHGFRWATLPCLSDLCWWFPPYIIDPSILHTEPLGGNKTINTQGGSEEPSLLQIVNQRDKRIAVMENTLITHISEKLNGSCTKKPLQRTVHQPLVYIDVLWY